MNWRELAEQIGKMNESQLKCPVLLHDGWSYPLALIFEKGTMLGKPENNIPILMVLESESTN